MENVLKILLSFGVLIHKKIFVVPGIFRDILNSGVNQPQSEIVE